MEPTPVTTSLRDSPVMESDEDLYSVEDATRRLYQSKTRLRKMRKMRDEGIGYEDVEKFVENLTTKKKVMKNQGYRERQILRGIMDLKLQDERKSHNLLKMEVKDLRQKLSLKMGKKSRELKRMKKHLGRIGTLTKRDMEKKYEKKIDNIRKKHNTNEI